MRRWLAVLALGVAVAGCNTPWQANIDLRKDNAQLVEENAKLKAAARAAAGTRVVSTQPGTSGGVDLDQLFTVSSLSFGRLTGVEDGKLRVFVTPRDAAGDDLKTVGGFEILAYDLSKGSNALVGQWTFTPEQARASWNGKGLVYGYVLECPLAAKVGGELRLHVAFQDLLTGRKIEGETQAKVLSGSGLAGQGG